MKRFVNFIRTILFLVLSSFQVGPDEQKRRVERKRRKYPSWCCQKCGAAIGWLGRLFRLHRCTASIDTPEFRSLLMAAHAAETRFEAVAGTPNQYMVFEEASQARQALIAYIDDPDRRQP